MKRLFALVCFFAVGQAFAAATLLNFSTSVYFAPPGMRGTSGIRVLDNGVIERFNNKGVATEVAELSPEALQALEAKIKALKVADVVSEDGPRCMDAPSTKMEVLKGRKTVVIYQRISCLEGTMPGSEDLVDFGRSVQGLGAILR